MKKYTVILISSLMSCTCLSGIIPNNGEYLRSCDPNLQPTFTTINYSYQPAQQDNLRSFMDEAHTQALRDLAQRNYNYKPQKKVTPPKAPHTSDNHESSSHWIGRQTTKVTSRVSSALWGKEIVSTPRTVIPDNQLEALRTSPHESDKKMYKEAMLKKPGVRQAAQETYKPFGEVIYKAGIAHEYCNTRFKDFLFDIRNDKEKHALMLELTKDEPRLIVNKDLCLRDYHEILNNYIYVKNNVFPSNTYSEPSSIIYTNDDKQHDFVDRELEHINVSDTYLDTVSTSKREMSKEEAYAIIDLDLSRGDEAAERVVKKELATTYLLDTVLTHADKEAFNPSRADWVKDSKEIDYVLANISHLTDDHLENFDPITRGFMLGIADVAQDKYALAKLMSPAGKGLIGGSFSVAKDIAIGSREKVTFVERVTYFFGEDNMDRHMAVLIDKSADEFKEFMDKENATVKKLLNPSGVTTEDIKKLGLSKSTENVIRYAIREYLNAKIHPNYTGAIKNNLSKSVTYARAYGQIKSGVVPSTGVRLGKGLIRRANDTIIRNSGSGNLSRAVQQVRSVKNVVDTAHAAGLLPKASDYDD